MKTCPVCKRTFEDNLTFCLMDGTVLSAPEDEIPSVKAPRLTVPAPTAILNPNPKTNPGGPKPPHLSTLVSPQPLPLYSPKQPSQTNERQSRKPWLLIAIALLVVLLLIAGAIAAFVFLGKDDATPGNRNVNSNVNANVPSSTDCFARDPGAGSTNRATHYSWAKDQTVERLQGNLNFKLDLLFQCKSMNAQSLSDRYADASVIIASYVPDANCFGGDTGVVSNNRSDHKAWGLSQGADGMRGNLEWKISSALKCLERPRQASLFSDVSVALAGGGDAVNDDSDSNANTNVRSLITPTPTPRVERWGPTNESASLKGERLTYYRGTTAAQCKADCDRNPRCQGFTLIRAGTYNPDDPPMCYLMSVATEMVPTAGHISAIKR